MYISEAIEILDGYSKKINNSSIKEKLDNVIKNLRRYDSITNSYKLPEKISDIINEPSTSIIPISKVDQEWLNKLQEWLNKLLEKLTELYENDTSEKKYAKCEAKYKEHSKEIDVEKITSWTHIISAPLTILLFLIGLIFKIKIEELSIYIAILPSFIGLIITLISFFIKIFSKKKHDNDNKNPYKIDELLAIEYKKNPVKLWMLSRNAYKILKRHNEMIEIKKEISLILETLIKIDIKIDNYHRETMGGLNRLERNAEAKQKIDIYCDVLRKHFIKLKEHSTIKSFPISNRNKLENFFQEKHGIDISKNTIELENKLGQLLTPDENIIENEIQKFENSFNNYPDNFKSKLKEYCNYIRNNRDYIRFYGKNFSEIDELANLRKDLVSMNKYVNEQKYLEFEKKLENIMYPNDNEVLKKATKLIQQFKSNLLILIEGGKNE